MMSPPESIELDHPDFITIDTIGPPGQRTFYLQAAQGDRLITVIIEKEQAAAVAMAIGHILQRLDWERDDEPGLESLHLIGPVHPIFRVAQLQVGYDPARDMLALIARELVVEEDRPGTSVTIWATPAQMAALARQAAVQVASGRPICPLCHEVIDPGEKHVCERGNGRKRVYSEAG